MWESLGLDDKPITALASTEWGLFAGTQFDGVFRWDEASREWTPLGLDHAIVSSLVYVPGDTSRLLVGMRPYAEDTTAAAIFASTDGGGTWEARDGGLAQAHGARYWAFTLGRDPHDANRLICGNSGDILLSEDAGDTWESVWGGGGFGPAFYDAVVSPDVAGTLWLGGATAFFNAIVLRSRDGGRNWAETFPLEGEENVVYELATVPGYPDRLIAGMEGGIVRSDDAGDTWKVVLRDAGGIHGFARTEGCLFATWADYDQPRSLGLYRSCDGGTSWKPVWTPGTITGGSALVADSRGRLIIGTISSGVWRVKL